MRTTLHVVPLDLAPIVHVATLAQRTAGPSRDLARNGVSGKEVRRYKDGVLNSLVENARESRVLVLFLKKHQLFADIPADRRAVVVRAVIKLLWEEGTICYVNHSKHWAREERYFDLTANRYPSLQLGGLSEREAIRELVQRHIGIYGPVSVDDIQWWSGLRRSQILAAIEELQGEVANVVVDDLPGDFLVARKEPGQSNPSRNWLSFLSHEDALLKAYHPSTRGRYVREEHYNILFNAIGEARSSVMVNGEVIGLWRWDQHAERVGWSSFPSIKIDKALREAINREARELREFLRRDSYDNVRQSLPWV